jgi:hypothetical protein
LGSGTQLSAHVTFTDQAPTTGTSAPSYGRGAAMVDIDGDGLLDLVAANDSMRNHFYRQRSDHTFADVSNDWGIADEQASWAVLVADFDNDGDNDVYFVNGGFPGQPNRLLRNDIGTTGALTDVSNESGDANVDTRTVSGTALDYNRDGLLDIFCSGADSHNFLLRNEGGLVFTDVSASAGMTESGSHRHCSIGDYNNDGWIDIAVGDFFEENVLYRNNADGTFTDVAAEAGVESPIENFGLVLEDFDNDGWMDIYVPKYRYIEDPPVPHEPSQLFRNNGDGTFTDVTEGSGMTAQTDMGHNTGDVDADGYPDIFIGTGHPGFMADDLLLLIRPDGAGGLVANDVSDSSGITSNGPTRCHGIAMGDYDQDGYVDIYTNNGGPPSGPEQLQENFLWRSDGNVNNWTALQLEGVCSNRTAVGARTVAILDSGREVHRMLRVGNGFGNTSSHIQHYGMNANETVNRIDIYWPSGIVQTVVSPPMQQVTQVREQRMGDLDGDGPVGVSDVLLLLSLWGPCGDCGSCSADLNSDCNVGVLDFLLLLSSWGPCP